MFDPSLLSRCGSIQKIRRQVCLEPDLYVATRCHAFWSSCDVALASPMGPVRLRHSSHDFGWQSNHSVDLAGWKAKMASIEIWIPWRNAHKPHYPYSKPVPVTLFYASFELSLMVHELPQGTYRLTVTTSVYIYIMIGVDCQKKPSKSWETIRDRPVSVVYIVTTCTSIVLLSRESVCRSCKARNFTWGKGVFKSL